MTMSFSVRRNPHHARDRRRTAEKRQGKRVPVAIECVSYTSSTVEPVVLRAARSAWALAASFKG